MAPKRFVYVLKSGEAAPRYYVGLTGDVRQRLAWHNDGRCGHTAKYRPWRTHVVLEFSDEEHATRFRAIPEVGIRASVREAPLRLTRTRTVYRTPRRLRRSHG